MRKVAFHSYRRALSVMGGIILCLSSSVFAYTGGSGTEADPYQISTVSDWNDLMNTSSDWSKHFIMTADVNLQGVALTPIGNFTGVFNGNNHVISNVDINTPASYNVALFGGLDLSGQIRNLGLVNVRINGTAGVGGLAGGNYGTITNCYVMGGSVTGGFSIGGLVGKNGNWSEQGSIIACYADVTVTGEGGGGVGGLAGSNKGSITNSYAVGDVFGGLNSSVGGLIGTAGPGTVSNCYASGLVAGSSGHVGGLVGDNVSAIINSSFWDVNTSGQTTSAGGTGKTTAEMQTLLTFTSAGWDFLGERENGYLDTWRMCVDGVDYPKLSWQFPRGDFVCPDGVDFEDLLVFCDQWLLEELSADIKPDGIVNFLDYAEFANNWQGDTNSLADFSSQWLESSAYCADIAPKPDGDGVVNMLDFAAFAENWLKGVNEDGYIQWLNVQPCDAGGGQLGLDSNDTRFSITVQGNNLYFEDLINANCCKDEIRLNISVEGNKITIYETEITPNPCHCLCDFPTTALLGPFADGDYTVEVFDVGGNSLGTVEVTIPQR